MPLVQIDVRKGKDAAHPQNIDRMVYDALVSAGTPEKGRLQIIEGVLINIIVVMQENWSFGNRIATYAA